MSEGYVPGAGEAMRQVERHGDFSGIRARVEAGHTLTAEELAALDGLERGLRAKTGPKDPGTDFETLVCWRWQVERDGRTGPDARSLLAEIMGVKADTTRARLARATGLGKNIADLCFDLHVQREVIPALLRHRDAKGHCLTCRKVRCRCDNPPRPVFRDTPEGAQVRALLAFWASR
jgi:hypothetical protein